MNTELIRKECGKLLGKVRRTVPLIHHITNYVTVNDCANITLAIGASPIMADAPEEAADITAISSALVLNMGTLNSRTVESMLISGKKANEKGLPVIFDPVGAGASPFRNQMAERILREVNVDVLRGNISEIRFIAGLQSETKGVDASLMDMEGGEAPNIARDLAGKMGCVVAITGAVDAISDGVHTLCVKNGNPAMSGITGTGCMCSSLIGSFGGIGEGSLLTATIAGILCMGIAGEISFTRERMSGNGNLRIGIINAVSLMDADILTGKAELYEA